MKNTFVLIALLTGLLAHAQINLENTYSATGKGYTTALYLNHFSGAGYKYVYIINETPGSALINIYNLNYSIYKSIATPAIKAISMSVSYVSDSLFNTSVSNIEYLLNWSDSVGVAHAGVYDDAGNALLNIDSAYSTSINFSTSGWKLIAANSSSPNNATKVFGLPGALPCDECSASHNLSGIAPIKAGQGSYELNGYPNPAKGSIQIVFSLPENVNRGEIIFYDLQGSEIKRFNVDNTFKKIDVSTNELAPGAYFYVLKGANGIFGAKKMVVIKQ